MPNWNEINNEIDASKEEDPSGAVRRKYLGALEGKTGRSVIAYYSGWLQNQAAGGPHPESAISDLDMNGMMAVVHNLNRQRGLDLMLHTPGGGIEAARAMVEYLYKMFGYDIRVIVPHMAMSSGTMIACAAREIIMGKHSCLGPTDPQVRGLPAMGILQEVDQAVTEIRQEPLKQFVWSQVFAKYPPAFILDCERSVQGTKEMVTGWLRSNMLKDERDPAGAATHVVAKLMDYKGVTEHGQHFPIDKVKGIGLQVLALEDDQELQSAVLSAHHAFVASFARTSAIKIIENACGGNWSVSA